MKDRQPKSIARSKALTAERVTGYADVSICATRLLVRDDTTANEPTPADSELIDRWLFDTPERLIAARNGSDDSDAAELFIDLVIYDQSTRSYHEGRIGTLIEFATGGDRWAQDTLRLMVTRLLAGRVIDKSKADELLKIAGCPTRRGRPRALESDFLVWVAHRHAKMLGRNPTAYIGELMGWPASASVDPAERVRTILRNFRDTWRISQPT